ncbi:MAG: bifunctional diaminohydroxyphosphoribosylaminopyrimidine deaminase/5-amino-6-(5-phosphoribosylamino)uracil reductase RibD [Gemmatimonadota bacterium]|nr:bifunctional diaminohydroxyphosphoribosylaminopyrimidine deaminase/5-amino-6-(5-phosphoribosylamino)uracil reductase RibD [Gemmatimonadota bacterium]
MSATTSPEDLDYLERARHLAHEGWGRVQPNPLVGCVLVRDGRVVGEGFHARFGGPHAEIVALEAAGSAAEGATAYVTLEPCNHQGKTPPCSRALIRAGIARLVYGASDPGHVSRGGAATLRAAGVEVVGPLWSEREGRRENPAFFHTARHETPFVALKLAMSLDARIAAAPGTRTRITGPEAEREVHRLRSGFDAVMVGAGTLRADDPRLTVRLAPRGARPTRRVILDPGASVPDDAAVLDSDDPEAPVHLFTGEGVDARRIERLEDRGIEVHPVEEDAHGLDLGRVTGVLWDLGVRSVLCEGGRKLAGRLLAEGRVQRLYLFVAPLTLGGGGLPAFTDDADRLDWSGFEPGPDPAIFGRDTLLTFDRTEP